MCRNLQLKLDAEATGKRSMAHDIFRNLIAKKNKTKQTSSQCNCYPLVFALAKYIFIFSDRNSICGKVMFSQACVKNSVHGGGGIPACYGACISLGRHSPRQLSTPPRQTSTASPRQTLPGRHPLQDGHCSGRYASYWNAFLLSLYYFQKECGLFDYGLEPRRAHCYVDIIADRLPEPQQIKHFR